MSDAASVLLSAHGIQKSFLERMVLDDVTFAIHEGDRVALLGANGAGKSTLFSILSGRLEPDAGEVRTRRGVRMAVLSQGGDLVEDRTVGQTLDEAFAGTRALQRELDDVHHRLESHPPDTEALLARQVQLAHELEHRDPHTIEARTEEAMQALGLPAPDRVIAQLSGGERRRVSLCRAILEDADLLLLDEPTNHLDAEALDWLEQFLQRFRGTVLLVTHDRWFLDGVATTMVELHRGRTATYPGNYGDYLEAKAAEAERAERVESNRRNLMRTEVEWLRRQPKARTTKAKARVDRATDLIASRPEGPDPTAEFFIPSGPRLGKSLVEATGISHSLGGRKLIDNFTMTLGPGDRIGVVGRNGLGKTTLLRLLMKQMEPDSGRVVHGGSIRFAYADQARSTLDPDKTVLEEIAGDVEYVQCGEQRVGIRSWLRQFLFSDQTAAMPIRLLSGGERNRVQIAKMLREGGNVVVLDEPTNDLDLPTLRILEEAIASFPGCAFIVSHDRYFLDRVATRIVAFRGGGRITIVEGNYEDYRRYLDREAAAQRKESRAEEAPADAAPRAKREAAGTRKKLSFNEQREFESIEQRILEAEERLAALTSRINDPQTFVTLQHQEAADLLKSQTDAQATVDQLYSRWAELSERA